jgi:subtilisin family serine protease
MSEAHRLSLDAPPFAGRTGRGVRVAVVDSGTVAGAIREKAPDCELLSVKVFHDRLATNVASLANAIEQGAEAGARLINLSLGTANPEHETLLAGAVARAATLGAIVVSAREANGVRWLPGALAGVVGVIADWEGPRVPTDARAGAFVIVASAYPRPIPGVPRERNLSGVSFAVANATAFLARLFEAEPGLRNSGDVGRMLG